MDNARKRRRQPSFFFNFLLVLLVFFLFLSFKALKPRESRSRYYQATFINRLNYPVGWMLKYIHVYNMDQKCFRLTHTHLPNTSVYGYTLRSEHSQLKHWHRLHTVKVIVNVMVKVTMQRACVSIFDAKSRKIHSIVVLSCKHIHA